MEHSDCQHCLGISVQNRIRGEITTCWVLIQNIASHGTCSLSAISRLEEVLLWHRFWQGGWFSQCFQMLCDKSSKTLKHPIPLLKGKSLDVATQKLVWVSSAITVAWMLVAGRRSSWWGSTGTPASRLCSLARLNPKPWWKSPAEPVL